MLLLYTTMRTRTSCTAAAAAADRGQTLSLRNAPYTRARRLFCAGTPDTVRPTPPPPPLSSRVVAVVVGRACPRSDDDIICSRRRRHRHTHPVVYMIMMMMTISYYIVSLSVPLNPAGGEYLLCRRLRFHKHFTVYPSGFFCATGASTQYNRCTQGDLFKCLQSLFRKSSDGEQSVMAQGHPGKCWSAHRTSDIHSSMNHSFEFWF